MHREVEIERDGMIEAKRAVEVELSHKLVK
jgi:hypothetical protein